MNGCEKTGVMLCKAIRFPLNMGGRVFECVRKGKDAFKDQWAASKTVKPVVEKEDDGVYASAPTVDTTGMAAAS